MSFLLLRIRRRLFGGRIVMLTDEDTGWVYVRLAKTYGSRKLVRLGDGIIELPDGGKTSRLTTRSPTWAPLEDA